MTRRMDLETQTGEGRTKHIYIESARTEQGHLLCAWPSLESGGLESIKLISNQPN